jgi:transposase
VEYYGKIISGELDFSLKSIKYTLLTDNSEKVVFYNNRSLVNFLNTRCKVKVEKSPNGEYSLGKSIVDLEKKVKKNQALIPIEGQVKQDIKKLVYNLSNIPNELIQRQINKLEQKGYDRKEIADFYHRNERTIYRRIKLIDNQEKQRRGRPRKIKEDVSELLCYYAENDDNTATLRELSDYLSKETGQEFSIPTIFRVLKRRKISWKKADKQFSEQNKEKIKQFVKDNCWLLSLSSLYSLDECSFNLGAVPRYARAHKSKRAVVKRPGNKGSNYTLILSVQNLDKGEINYELIKGGAEAWNFYDYLKNMKTSDKEKRYILLDNVRIHHAVKVLKELGLPSIKELAEQKNIVLVYLPSYTPESNPTENCNSIIKHLYRKCRPRTEEALRKTIEEGIAELKKHNLRKFFKSAFDYENWH